MSSIANSDTESQTIKVRLDGETVWLSQTQMTSLFDVLRGVVSKYLEDIFSSREKEWVEAVSKMEATQKEGRRTVSREVAHYKLDANIAGYWVNFTRATYFSQCAMGVLLRYLVEGYSLNRQRLQEGAIEFERGVGEELFHPNVASWAAYLLYFLLNNYSLVDANKRTGSFLFLWYLRLNLHLLTRPVECLINDNTLVALAHWLLKASWIRGS